MSSNKSKSKAATPPKAEGQAPAKKQFQAAGQRYWRSPMHFTKLGLCVGKVTEEQEILFRASSPKSDILKWTTATDEMAAKRKELKNKRRREIGLDTKE